MKTSAAASILALALLAILVAPRAASAHCQVPCGIYDDPARITAMKEDAATIAKAVTGIHELAGKSDAQSWNQAIRWTTTKEDHASHIIDVVAEYFLTQKVKPVAAGADGHQAYLESLADHHAVMRAAMATKQSANPDAVAELVAAIAKLAARY